MKNVSFVRIYNNNDNNNHDKPLFSLNYPANTLMEKRGGIISKKIRRDLWEGLKRGTGRGRGKCYSIKISKKIK